MENTTWKLDGPLVWVGTTGERLDEIHLEVRHEDEWLTPAQARALAAELVRRADEIEGREGK